MSPALAIAADTAGIGLDVKTVTAAGKVTLNGALPVLGASCTAPGAQPSSRLTFIDARSSYAFGLETKCGDTAFGFTGSIYPGTYEVRIQGNGAAYSNLPQAPANNVAYKAVSQIQLRVQ